MPTTSVEAGGLPPAARAQELQAPTSDALRPVLPVSEYSYTQLAPGRFEIDLKMLAADEFMLIRARVEPLSAGIIVADPAYIAFNVPLRWQGRYLYNGAEVRRTSLCMATGSDGYRSVGAGREVISIGLRRARFVDTIAALRGVDPDEVRLADGVLELPDGLADRLRAGLLSVLACEVHPSEASSAGGPSLREAREAVYALLIDAYAATRAGAHAEVRGQARRKEIVRRAEERFMAAVAEPVSLADLCQAAGVGRTALRQAFHGLYDESPLNYLHKRRLTLARETLYRSAPGRGAVKQAALGAGLTALGRFSGEYRRLFGESPSATLARRQK